MGHLKCSIPDRGGWNKMDAQRASPPDAFPLSFQRACLFGSNLRWKQTDEIIDDLVRDFEPSITHK